MMMLLVGEVIKKNMMIKVKTKVMKMNNNPLSDLNIHLLVKRLLSTDRLMMMMMKVVIKKMKTKIKVWV